jgi:hypothetical protein
MNRYTYDNHVHHQWHSDIALSGLNRCGPWYQTKADNDALAESRGGFENIAHAECLVHWHKLLDKLVHPYDQRYAMLKDNHEEFSAFLYKIDFVQNVAKLMKKTVKALSNDEA